MEIAPPAKLNLYLRVGPAAADGYHPLATWMVTIGLYDRLSFRVVPEPIDDAEEGRQREPGWLRLRCDEPSVPVDDSNLVARAAKRLMEEAGVLGTWGAGALELELSKRIPAGGGLGGGSSDAAATLVGLSRLLKERLGLVLPEARTQRLAAALGSDVPFFWTHLRHHLSHSSDARVRSAECTGRGEVVRAAPEPRPTAALLILPTQPDGRPLACPTPAVYRRFDELTPTGGDLSGPTPDDLADLPAGDLLPNLQNHLQKPAFDLFPTLARLAADVEARLGRPVLLSGSGSTLFTLYDTSAEAHSAADLLAATRAADAAARFRAMAVTLPG